jgi:hypothetical protein
MVAITVACTATAWWLTRRARRSAGEKTRSDLRSRQHPVPERLSHHRWPSDEAFLDGAVEDTFPASDPPAFTQAVIAGSPPHERRREELEDEIAEAHPS